MLYVLINVHHGIHILSKVFMYQFFYAGIHPNYYFPYNGYDDGIQCIIQYTHAHIYVHVCIDVSIGGRRGGVIGLQPAPAHPT